MKTGKIEIICGNGSGKTALALGRGIQALTKQKDVIVIQFLKGNQKQEDLDVIKRLEPQMKVFRFEKSDSYFEHLSEEEKREELLNIRNGLGYAKKVLCTGECELLILDEVLGLVDQSILTVEELETILECRDESDVILTGRKLPDRIGEIADQIDRIEKVEAGRTGMERS